jgi:class 3 adenylate cyclase
MSTPASTAQVESWLELTEGRTFWLKGRCAVGRTADNDLVIDLPGLSRRHALFAPAGSRYALSDLHSRNGTFVNGLQVTRPVNLRDGDEIRFGDVGARFRCTRQFDLSEATVGIAQTQRLDQVREVGCWLLLVDVEGYTALNEKVGSGPALRRLQTWITGVRPLIEGHGGHINGYLGDAIFAYWQDDKASPAQALASLRAIEAWRCASPLSFRVVAHHGTVLFTHSDRGEELTGQAVIFTFRIEKVAKALGAGVMLSEAAVRTLGLEGLCGACGSSSVDGMAGVHPFFSMPAP